MEFAIDFAMTRKLVAVELIQAAAEIATLGPVRAYQHSLQRHDERLANASDANTLACKDGCSWCCYFSVDVRPVEVLNILEFIDNELSPAEQQRVQSEVIANSLQLDQLDELERMQRNIKCPFLVSDRCSIYAARPQTCRNYHATNAAGCRQSYEEPGNLDIAPEYAPLVYQAGAAHVDAVSKAMSDAGYDVTAFEINAALAEAFSQPALLRRQFAAKQRVFVGLAGTDAPLDFIESD